MIKIEFPSDNKPLAGAIGRALCEYSGKNELDGYIESGIDAIEKAHGMRPGTLTGDPELSDTVEDDIPEFNQSGNANAGTATEPASSTQSETSNAGAKVDPKGVAFDAAYCSEAKIPFYASGKTKDQWKKKKGVTEEDYNEWYTSCLANVAPTGETKEDAPLDTSAAFSGQDQQKTEVEVPKDCGAFMGWISGQQAANHLNQHDITDAYAKLGLQVTDLFPPNNPNQISARIYDLFKELGGLE